MDAVYDDVDDNDNIDWQERIIELKRVTKASAIMQLLPLALVIGYALVRTGVCKPPRSARLAA